MIQPRPRFFIAGSRARMSRKTPVRLVSTMAAKSSGEVSSTGAMQVTPAAGTTRSAASQRARISSAQRSRATASRTSQGRMRPRSRCPASASVSSSGSCRRPSSARSYPRRASSRAISRPRPEPPPLTTATRASVLMARSLSGGLSSPALELLLNVHDLAEPVEVLLGVFLQAGTRLVQQGLRLGVAAEVDEAVRQGEFGGRQVGVVPAQRLLPERERPPQIGLGLRGLPLPQVVAPDLAQREIDVRVVDLLQDLERLPGEGDRVRVLLQATIGAGDEQERLGHLGAVAGVILAPDVQRLLVVLERLGPPPLRVAAGPQVDQDLVDQPMGGSVLRPDRPQQIAVDRLGRGPVSLAVQRVGQALERVAHVGMLVAEDLPLCAQRPPEQALRFLVLAGLDQHHAGLRLDVQQARVP